MKLKNKLKQYVRLGQRGAYGQSMLSLAQENEQLFCLSADLGNSSGLDRFSSKYPDRYLNVGIAEQHLIGFASGLSTIGYNCFVSSFAPFITMRCCEQIRMNLGYMQENVKIVSLGSGISMGYLGNSHFGLEDISIMSSQNNIPIFCPSDTTQLYFMLEFLGNYIGPAYLRLTGTAATSNLIYREEQYQSNESICLGGSITIREGKKLLILSHGNITYNCIKAIDLLENKYKECCHHEDVYCVRPLGDKIIDLINSYDCILVVEEHRKTGGLYSHICEIAAKKRESTLIEPCTLPDKFLSEGDYDDLKESYGLDIDSLLKRIRKLLT